MIYWALRRRKQVCGVKKTYETDEIWRFGFKKSDIEKAKNEMKKYSV